MNPLSPSEMDENGPGGAGSRTSHSASPASVRRHLRPDVAIREYGPSSTCRSGRQNVSMAPESRSATQLSTWTKRPAGRGRYSGAPGSWLQHSRLSSRRMAQVTNPAADTCLKGPGGAGAAPIGSALQQCASPARSRAQPMSGLPSTNENGPRGSHPKPSSKMRSPPWMTRASTGRAPATMHSRRPSVSPQIEDEGWKGFDVRKSHRTGSRGTSTVASMGGGRAASTTVASGQRGPAAASRWAGAPTSGAHSRARWASGAASTGVASAPPSGPRSGSAASPAGSSDPASSPASRPGPTRMGDAGGASQATRQSTTSRCAQPTTPRSDRGAVW